ncbi:hypothetical protein ES703_58264 [subsurface metagenome]
MLIEQFRRKFHLLKLGQDPSENVEKPAVGSLEIYRDDRNSGSFNHPQA